MVVRVEKYRPNSLEDVAGHEDILTTSKLKVLLHESLLCFETNSARLPVNKFVDSNVRIPPLLLFCDTRFNSFTFSGYHIYFSMGLLVQEKHPQSSLLLARSMALPDCDSKYLNSMPQMTVVSKLSASKLKHSPPQNKYSIPSLPPLQLLLHILLRTNLSSLTRLML